MQLYPSHRAHHALGQAYKTLVCKHLRQDRHISADSSNIFKTLLQSLTREVASNPPGPRTVRHPFFLEATSSRTHLSPSF